jgi:cytochrome bd-type quinol oxidase subunit 2
MLGMLIFGLLVTVAAIVLGGLTVYLDTKEDYKNSAMSIYALAIISVLVGWGLFITSVQNVHRELNSNVVVCCENLEECE